MARGLSTHQARARNQGLVFLPVNFTTDSNGDPTSATASGSGWSVTRTAASTYRIALDNRYVSVDGVYGAEYSADDVNGATPYVDVRLYDATVCGHVRYIAPIAAELISVVAADDPIADGALTVAAQPDFPRKLQVRIVDADSSVTAGTVTLVGVGLDGGAVTETIDFGAGGTQTIVTDYVYASLTSATVASVAGAAAGDTIGIGVGAALGLPIPAGMPNVSVVRAYADATSEAVGTVDTTARSIEPTTAADGAADFDFFYAAGGTKSATFNICLALNSSGTRTAA
jgi:hypothetical protein